MFIINIRFVCYLRFESDNILGKEKLHFVRKLNFLTPSPSLTSKGHFRQLFQLLSQPLNKFPTVDLSELWARAEKNQAEEEGGLMIYFFLKKLPLEFFYLPLDPRKSVERTSFHPRKFCKAKILWHPLEYRT